MTKPIAILLFAAAASAAAEQPASAPDPVLIGAGDIADCTQLVGAAKTAVLLDGVSGTVFTLGDNAYPSGTPKQFTDCYAPTWGRHKARTRPAAGNHDYQTPRASGYFEYFGAAAGDPDKGWYGYDVGAWHVVVLNSNCAQIGGCGRGSKQEKWLREDLAEHPAPCVAAMWHHPRFSSGAEHGDDPEVRDLWKALTDAGADVVVAGHEHVYERFAPQTADGKADPEHGLRQFTVGTGGRELYGWGRTKPNSEVRDNKTFGVLQLTLHPDGYDWNFLPIDGETFTDSGSAKCHPKGVPHG